MKLASSSNLIAEVKELLQNARRQTVRQVNQTMVLTYFEIGRKIVEEEQGGKERAEYGKGLLKELSKALTQDFGKGFSVDNLQNMRTLYTVYSKYETVSSNSQPRCSFQLHPYYMACFVQVIRKILCKTAMKATL